MSARQEDVNGYIEIDGNPISKVGVFPYLGGQIADDLERNKIYYVYRPESELSSQDCIDSFKLIPFTDDHAMLGASSDGLVPAEEKGVHGVTGENVYFEYPYLKSNVKIFSEHLSDEIENGKVELSIGYRCDYEPMSGTFNGQQYDFVQTNIRGNHLALVEEGRSGKDVKVLDHSKFTFDSGVLKMEEEMKDMPNVDESTEAPKASLEEKIDTLITMMGRIVKAEEAEANSSNDEKPENPYAKDADTSMPDGETKASDESDDDDEEEDDGMSEDKKSVDAKAKDKKTSDKKSMDSKPVLDINDIKKSVFIEIEKRNKLYQKVSNITGHFAHDSMSIEDVAQYGIKHLGLKCKKGHEEAVIEGYLAGLKKASFYANNAMDVSYKKSDAIEDFINKGAN